MIVKRKRVVFFFVFLYLIGVAAQKLYADTPVVNRIVGHWTLDANDFHDGYYLDISGEENNAGAGGNPAFVDGIVTGDQDPGNMQPAGAVQVTADDGWAQVGALDPAAETGQWSVSVWFKWNANGGDSIYNNIFSKRDGWGFDAMEYMVHVFHDQRVIMETAGGGWVGTGYIVIPDRWHHLVVTYKNGYAKIYLDGKLEAANNYVMGDKADATFWIGRNETANEYFDGALDDFRIYNYALEHADIYDLYNAEVGSPLDFKFAPPDHLYVVDYHSPELNEAQRVALITLQGVLAQTKPEIYFLDYEDGRYAVYLEDMKERYEITTTRRAHFDFYIGRYKDDVEGYVLYDIEDSDSFSAAMSLTGILRAVAIDISLESHINSRWPDFEKLKDCRGKDQQWVYDHYWDQFNHNAIIMHHTDTHEKPFLRDWGAAIKAISWWSDDYSATDQVVSSLHANSSAWGWGNPALEADELTMVDFVSARSVFQVPSNHMLNLPTFAGMASYEPKIELEQPFNKQERQKHTDVHHVAFMMSDMDNINVLFRPPPGWLDSPHFGKFPMGWGMPGAMVETAPTVIDWWYRNVPATDSFSMQGGLGYMYPSKFPALDAYSSVLNRYMKDADILTLVIPDIFWPEDLSYNNYKEIAGQFTRFENLSGLFYVDVGGDYARYNGKILWFDGKPMVTTRFTLWQAGQYQGVSSNGLELADSINQLATDSTGEDGYTFVIVHAWSYDLDEVWTTVQNLNENVRVVSSDELIEQLYFNTDVAYWPFERDANNHFQDNHHGVISGAELISGADVKRGIGAMIFDGVDDYIEFGTSAGSSKWLTIAFWMKANQFAGQIPVDKLPNDNSGTGWNIKLRENGELWFRLGSEFNHQDVRVPDGYSVGDWVHVACTLNENEARVYLNGQLAGERTDITNSAANTTTPLRMGRPSEAAVDEAFAGILDDVVIFGRPLGHDQIKELMATGPCWPSLKGDLNKDCRVDEIDLMLFARNWLDSGDDMPADVTGNGTVNFEDFAYLAENWHK